MLRDVPDVVNYVVMVTGLSDFPEWTSRSSYRNPRGAHQHSSPTGRLNMAALPKAKVLLLAAAAATDADIAALRTLIAAYSRTLHLDLVLRLLLSALPESTEPASYTPFLLELESGVIDEPKPSLDELDHAAVEDLDEVEARSRVKALRPLPLACAPAIPGRPTDSLTLFLIHRCRRIDAQTGILTLLPELITPFLGRSDALRTWFIATLLPLLRFNYEYYPSEGATLSLAEFEGLSARSALRLLLSRTGRATDESLAPHDPVGRDLRGLVGPWMYKSKKPTASGNADSASGDDDRTWQDAFEWLLDTASTNFPLVVEAVEQWDGPDDVDLGGYEDDATAGPFPNQSTKTYARTGLAAIYIGSGSSIESFAGAHRILVRLASLLGATPPLDLAAGAAALHAVALPLASLAEASSLSLLSNALAQPTNSLTTPDDRSISFLEAVILSAYLLARLGNKLDVRAVAGLVLSADEVDQRKALKRLIHDFSSGAKLQDSEWSRIHREVFWIWRWGMDEDSQTVSGVLGSVPRETLEKEFLKLLLLNTRKSGRDGIEEPLISS